MRTLSTTALRNRLPQEMKKTAPVRIVDKSGATRYLISEKALMRLQEQQDIMEAEKALKRIRSGKEKVMTADQLLDYLGV